MTIEARFQEGEYQILTLSAKDSGGLDTWLRLNKYKIPEGAAEALAFIPTNVEVSETVKGNFGAFYGEHRRRVTWPTRHAASSA